MPFKIIRNDITRVRADAIVNTANPRPEYAGGTDTAIYMAAGPEQLLEARRKIGNIEPGEAFATPAFKLDARYIIHTVGPMWIDGSHGEFEILERCYENSLKLAVSLKCKTIAFPLIATGIYGFPRDKALQIALSVIQKFLLEQDMTVILVVFDMKSFELSGKLIENVREYVSSNYVEAAFDKEYGCGTASGVSGRNAGSVASGRLSAYERAKAKSLPASKTKMAVFQEIVSNPDKTFQEKLFEIIDGRGLTGPQVYKGYISKQVFSKLQSDRNYHPNKYTAIALCLSLRLNLEDTLDLIGRAGWALSSSNKMDLVVKGCIINGEYSVENIDSILFEMGLPQLEKIK